MKVYVFLVYFSLHYLVVRDLGLRDSLEFDMISFVALHMVIFCASELGFIGKTGIQ